MKSKVCIICSEEKEITEFYTHPKMGDGRLNKCKTCCKKQAKERHYKLFQDPEWREKEKERSKERYYRLNYKEKQKKTNKKYPWKQKNRYKNLRKWYESKHGCLDKNIELHHWSYKYKNLRDVIPLSCSTHRKIHTKLILSIEDECFKTIDGELLDTKEKHLNYINQFI